MHRPGKIYQKWTKDSNSPKMEQEIQKLQKDIIKLMENSSWIQNSNDIPECLKNIRVCRIPAFFSIPVFGIVIISIPVLPVFETLPNIQSFCLPPEPEFGGKGVSNFASPKENRRKISLKPVDFAQNCLWNKNLPN